MIMKTWMIVGLVIVATAGLAVCGCPQKAGDADSFKVNGYDFRFISEGTYLGKAVALYAVPIGFRQSAKTLPPVPEPVDAAPVDTPTPPVAAVPAPAPAETPAPTPEPVPATEGE